MLEMTFKRRCPNHITKGGTCTKLIHKITSKSKYPAIKATSTYYVECGAWFNHANPHLIK